MRGAFANYNDSDEESHQSSLFSVHQSSATSQTSITSDSISNTALEQLVSLLLGQERLRSLCVLAVEDSGVGPDRFERNFRRLLKGYATDLKNNVGSGEHQQQNAAVNFITYRGRIAATRVRRACDKGYEDRKLKIAVTKEDKTRRVEAYLN